MKMPTNRRTVLLGLAAALPLGASIPAMAQEKDKEPKATEPAASPKADAPVTGDIVLGDDKATVTVYEYASLTCPHCADFHINTWPKVKAEFVDKGLIKFVMRDVYFDQFGLWAAMTARCGGAKGYWPMVDQFMRNQQDWTRADDIGAEIQKIGRRAGLSNQAIKACLSDRDYAKKLIETYQDNAKADGVEATPTFIINGEKFSGAKSFEEFSEILNRFL